MILLVAQMPEAASSWNVVLVLSVLVSLSLNAVGLVRGFGSKSSERQVAPTQLAAIQTDLGGLAKDVSAIREMQAAQGERIQATKESVDALSAKQQRDTEGLYKRVNAISEDLARIGERVNAQARPKVIISQ